MPAFDIGAFDCVAFDTEPCGGAVIPPAVVYPPTTTERWRPSKWITKNKFSTDDILDITDEEALLAWWTINKLE
jgi:hypothetical protein